MNISSFITSSMPGNQRFKSLTSAFVLSTTVVFAISPALSGRCDPLPQSKAGTQARDEWSGAYLSGSKVGYGHTTVEPTTFGGKPALKVTSKSIMHLNLLGTALAVDQSSFSITDLQSRPLSQKLVASSNGSEMLVNAIYDYDKGLIHCIVGSGANASKKDVTIPKGVSLASDTDFATSGKKVFVGEKFTVYTLNPATLVLEPVRVEITGREEIRNEDGKKIPVFVVKETLTVGAGTVWIDAKGEAIKSIMEVGPLQIVVTSESHKHSLDTAFISPTVSSESSPAYTPQKDLAIVTSVSADKVIENPRKLTTLHAILSGIPDKRLMISDARQQETVVGNAALTPPLTVDLLINAEKPDLSNTLKLPLKDTSLSVYTGKAAYLNTDDDALRKTALKIKGDETDTYKIALAIRDWVHQSMTPDASIGVPRSASDVFGRRRGVCRDYATLYSALARIAGVPTRLCAGIVYADLDGHPAFFYHAWAESFVGQWIAVDPTLYDASLGVDYVDATHIKFAQGDVTDMYDAVSVVGKIKISIK